VAAAWAADTSGVLRFAVPVRLGCLLALTTACPSRTKRWAGEGSTISDAVDRAACRCVRPGRRTCACGTGSSPVCVTSLRRERLRRFSARLGCASSTRTTPASIRSRNMGDSLIPPGYGVHSVR
jgi:hypothetical protein